MKPNLGEVRQWPIPLYYPNPPRKTGPTPPLPYACLHVPRAGVMYYYGKGVPGCMLGEVAWPRRGADVVLCWRGAGVVLAWSRRGADAVLACCWHGADAVLTWR